MTASFQRDDTVQHIKDVADIRDIIGECVALKKSGANLKGLCPFHSEKTPSFMVNPARQSFHCFGCGEGGDIFSFMMKYHRLSFPEALKELARRYQIPLPEKNLSPQDRARAQKREALHKANEKAAEIYHDMLLNDPKAEGARQYLATRDIPLEAAKTFRLGYAPDSWDFLYKKLSPAVSPELACEAGLLVKKERGGYYDRFRQRILFPIYGMTGGVVGFGGRILGDGQPKYLNTPETILFDKSRTLFGIYQNRDFVRKEKQGIVVEGNFDMLSLVVHGIKNVVAPLGTAITNAHIRTLKGYADEIILLFDGDAAGLTAAMRAVPLFLNERIDARIAVLPEKHDPDSLVREHGAGELRKLVDRALSLPEFVFDRLVDKFGLTLEGKGHILAELKPIIEAIGDQDLQQTVFVAHFSQKLGIPAERLLEKFTFARPARQKNAAKRPAGQVSLPFKEQQLLEFVITCPEHLPAFLNAGVEEVVAHPSGRAILAALRKMQTENPAAGPEQLLDLLEGAEKSFVSRLLITVPHYADDDKESTAAGMLGWLKKTALTGQKELLTQQLIAAQQSRNETLYMELIEKKKAIDEALTS